MTGCARKAELETLLRLGHWPGAAGEELVAHVRKCRKCSEIALLTQALTASKATAMREAPVEPPAVLWWRAHLRRRREMMQKVERPVRAQMLVLAIIVCVGLGLAFRLSGGVSEWHARISVGAQDVLRSGVGSLGVGLVALSAAAMAIMAAAAVYVIVERK